MGGFAKNPTHFLATKPRLRETPSLVRAYRPGLSLAALEGIGSMRNQAISFLRNSLCVHNRSPLPPIGFCSSSFLWYRMYSTLPHCSLFHVYYSTQAGPTPPAARPNSPTLAWPPCFLSLFSSFPLFSEDSCVTCFSHHCDKVLSRSCLRGRGLFWLMLKTSFHQDREDTASGLHWPHCLNRPGYRGARGEWATARSCPIKTPQPLETAL